MTDCDERGTFKVFRIQSHRLWIVVALAYLSCVFLSVIQFHLWNQVLYHDSLGTGLDPYALLTRKNALRYFLVLPAFELDDVFGVSADWLFSIFAACMILAAAWLVTRLVVLIQSDDSLFWPYLCLNTLAFISLSLFMNGRLSSAFAGISLIQLTLFERILGKDSPFWFLPKVIFGLWLCSVSSGCFLVSLTVVYTWLIFYWSRAFGNSVMTLSDVAHGLLLLLILYFIYPIAFLGTAMELEYFDNNWVKMLHHGLGEFVLMAGDIGFALFFIAWILGLTGWFVLWTRWPQYRLFWIILPCALILGLFGYSTMLTGLPAAMVLGNIWFINHVSHRLMPMPKRGGTLAPR